MIVIPRVDLCRGQCVQSPFPIGTARTRAPDGSGARNAAAVVRTWAHVGFRTVQVADLDAASGCGSNESLLDELIRDAGVEIDAFAAVDSREQIAQLVDAGATRIVLGARALDDAGWLASAADSFPRSLVVAAEVHGSEVVFRGRGRGQARGRRPPWDVWDVMRQVEDLPLGGFLVAAGTDSCRTATDLAVLEDLAEACPFPLIASGGVSSMRDLRALEHRGVSAVVLGRVLYSGDLDPYNVAVQFSE